MTVLSAQMQICSACKMKTSQILDAHSLRRFVASASWAWSCRHADDMLPLLKIMSGLPDSTEDHAQKKIQVFDNAKQDPFRRRLCLESQTSNECFWQDPLVHEYRSPPSWGLPKLGPLRAAWVRG